MSGALPEIPTGEQRQMASTAEMLRTAGVSDLVIKDALEGKPVTRKEHDLTVAWRDRHMKDEAWTKRLLGGDADAVRELHLMSIILSSPIKSEAAA